MMAELIRRVGISEQERFTAGKSSTVLPNEAEAIFRRTDH